MTAILRKAAKKALASRGLEVKRLRLPPELRMIPDAEFYVPIFSPWKGYGEFASYLALALPHSLITPDRLYLLYAFATNALRLRGDLWECGVYKGGTARLFAHLLEQAPRPETKLHLFDTFAGMPETEKGLDLHQKGDFADTSLDAVRQLVGHPDRVVFHPGWIPEAFAGLEDAVIALAHIDVDIYRSILDCCAFIYPRLTTGGLMLFDDYAFPSCPGARRAVDEFFTGKPETPIVLPSGQALVIKLPPPPE